MGVSPWEQQLASCLVRAAISVLTGVEHGPVDSCEAFLILLLILISCSFKALNTSAAMMSTAKDSSIFTQLLSRTFNSRTAQVVAPATSTEKQQQPLSSSSDKLNSSCSSQALQGNGVDWGRREPFLRLAHVFDTNNY